MFLSTKIFFLFMIVNTFGHHLDWSKNRKLDTFEQVKFTLIMNNENIHTLNNLYENISNPRHVLYG
jgi:hypothetical protein